ncbi:hypothetical protein [Massilia sp. Dwa41.01b]|uniref:hypothetical protein n=1 Tax=Massilia sp. Dwa41.01b TaxID=2709302 RepID=UPI00280520E9|nr:hypothetical protein [Massilia sp. Dwa41.01b]
MCHQRAGLDDRTAADGHAAAHRRAGADAGTRADDDVGRRTVGAALEGHAGAQGRPLLETHARPELGETLDPAAAGQAGAGIDDDEIAQMAIAGNLGTVVHEWGNSLRHNITAFVHK